MYPLSTSNDLDPLLEDIGDCAVVMLGEASHGTHEFYTWRTAISQRLINEKDFSFIAVEGDWPDCYKINRFIKGYNEAGSDSKTVLGAFDRWPAWMWANWEVAAFSEWLHSFNKNKPGRKIGFYGLDVYSLWDSMREMLNYLEKEDPQAAITVRKAIQCFEPFNEDEFLYARHTGAGISCRDELVSLLKEIRLKAQFLDGDEEAGFNTEQNALIAVNAEKYYTTMLGFDNESWNIRDRHMMETLDRLMQFHGKNSKAIIWAHNTHIGDARATDMKRAGMINLGQLAREKYGNENVYLGGFGSYSGTVMAGEAWGAPMQEMEVPPARTGSIEYELHRESEKDRYYLLNNRNLPVRFHSSIRHRAIGVVYDPKIDAMRNYVPSELSKRYDAFIYLDQTKALHPLHIKTDMGKMPESYPFGV